MKILFLIQESSFFSLHLLYSLRDTYFFLRHSCALFTSVFCSCFHFYFHLERSTCEGTVRQQGQFALLMERGEKWIRRNIMIRRNKGSRVTRLLQNRKGIFLTNTSSYFRNYVLRQIRHMTSNMMTGSQKMSAIEKKMKFAWYKLIAFERYNYQNNKIENIMIL